MFINSSILAIPFFVAIMVATPLILGYLFRKFFMKKATAQLSSRWSLLGQILSVLGWCVAFGLGKSDIMTYQAAVMLSGLLYVPGLFILGMCTRNRANT